MKKKTSIFLIITILLTFLMACQPKKLEEKEYHLNIGSLKGATTIGLAHLMDEYSNKPYKFQTKDKDINLELNFKVQGLAEELISSLNKGEIDLAAIPANLASNIYNKTDGEISVVAINTLGVLYMVDNSGEIKSIKDLEGKTIYSLGKGSTPEGVLNSFIKSNNIKNTRLEYKSEASEIAALLANKENIIALLPEPFVTVVEQGNHKVERVFDMNEEWAKAHRNNSLVTGVLVARKGYLDNNKDILDKFLQEYEKSIEFAKLNPEKIGPIIEDLGIVPRDIGALAIPKMNMEYIDGREMKDLLESYLEDLYRFNPDLIGGSLPDADFYYKK